MTDELPTCPESGKQSFPTKYLPKEMRVRRKGKKVAALEMYRCHSCKFFHTTKGKNKKAHTL